jgi:hypothetical protein
MRAARDEGHVRAGLGQRRTKPASDTAGADNRNPHGNSPVAREYFVVPRYLKSLQEGMQRQQPPSPSTTVAFALNQSKAPDAGCGASRSGYWSRTTWCGGAGG